MSRRNQYKLAWLSAAATVAFGTYVLYKRSQPKVKEQKPQQALEPNDLDQNRFLTQRLAVKRAKQIVKGSVSYELDLLLQKGEWYDALVTVKFQVNNVKDDLYIDFRGTEVNVLRVNGEDVPIQWNKLFLILPKTHLKVGRQNQVQIKIHSKYQTDGTGLHSYVDSADGKQYLYSQGESYFCNRFFPCFDQPDIKAPLKFQIVAPKDWTVVSNEPVQIQQPYSFPAFQVLADKSPSEWVQSVFNLNDPENYQLYTFGATPSLPSYLYCVVAGPYWSVQSDIGGIPQTLYCRESLSEHMLKLKDFVFEVTQKSMLFYEKFFGVQYPFKKYDSLFVPEFNFGAMENPGCVTFNDFYVFREQQPTQRYTSLANTIAHEMAHMWFGDYVTMRWWNDLWLNESYADFISHFCLSHLDIKSIPLTNIGVLFNTRKSWGYREDQMVTTHPIAGGVENTEKAETIFDGITYSKGASVMKQLLCIMGEEAFGRGCGAHFKKFAWDNATLEDLIESLDVEFTKQNQPFSLQDWQSEWIQKAGLNEIQPEWSSENPTVLKIHQTAALQEFPTLRRHKIKIALFNDKSEVKVIDAYVQNRAVTEVHLDAGFEYTAVLLNYEDESFVKVLLDERSLEFFKTRLSTIQDVLTRQIVWRSFFDLVRDAKISSEEYVDIVLHNIGQEAADEIVATQIMFLHSAVESMTPRNFKKVLSTRVFEFLVGQLRHIVGNNDPKLQNRLITFRDALFSYVVDDKLFEKLLAWKNDKDEDLKGVPLSNQSRWHIVEIAHAIKNFDHHLRGQLFEEQAQNDKSDTLNKMQRRCLALSATQDQYRDIWASFLDVNNKDSVKLQAEAMRGFNNSRRFQDLQEYQDKFFDVLLDVFKTRSTDYFKTFYAYLFPITDDLAYLARRLNETLSQAPPEAVTLRLEVSMSLDALKRKVKQFEVFGARAKLAQIGH